MPILFLEIDEGKGKKRGEDLVSSSVSEISIFIPRSRPRPQKSKVKDLGPRLVLVRRALEKL